MVPVERIQPVTGGTGRAPDSDYDDDDDSERQARKRRLGVQAEGRYPQQHLGLEWVCSLSCAVHSADVMHRTIGVIKSARGHATSVRGRIFPNNLAVNAPSNQTE